MNVIYNLSMSFFDQIFHRRNNSPQDRGPDHEHSFVETVTAPCKSVFSTVYYFMLGFSRKESFESEDDYVSHTLPGLSHDFPGGAYVSRTEYNPDDPVTPSFINRVGHSINSKLALTKHNASSQQMLEVSAKITLYLGNLIVCETVAQYIGATAQFIGSIAGTQISDLIQKRSQLIETQAGSPALDQLLGFVRNAKNVSMGFYESPTFLFFKDALGVAAICGLCTDIRAGDLELISSRFVHDAATTVKGDIVSTILRSFEFAFEVARDMACGCDLTRFVLGKGVMTVASDLLSRRDDFIRGMLMERYKIADSTYLSMLNDVAVDLDEFIRRKHGAEQALAINMKQRIQQVISEVRGHIVTSGFRKRPFTLGFFGKSGVGKSTLVPVVTKHFGAQFGIATAPENCVTINEEEKYDPVNGKTTVVILDDLCNTKGKAAELRPPTANLIKYNNVVPTMAVKADVLEKGCIPIKPELLLITTNVPHLNAYAYSNEPMSIFNRINMMLMVRPKSYCRAESGKLDYTKVKDGECPIEVSEMTYCCDPQGKVTITYAPTICWTEMEAIVMQRATKHRAHQDKCFADFKKKDHAVYCRDCMHEISRCSCEGGPNECRPMVENQGLVTTAHRLSRYFWPKERNPEAGVALVRLLTMTSSLTREAPILTRYFSNKVTCLFTEIIWAVAEYNEWTLTFSFLLFCYIVSSMDPLVSLTFFTLLAYLAYSVIYNTHVVATRLVTDKLVRSYRDRAPEVASELLDYVFFLPAIAVCLVFVRRLMVGMTFLNQGNLQPTGLSDITKRYLEPSEWAARGDVRAEFVASQKTKTTTASDVADKVARYTFTVSGPAKTAGKTVRCTALRVYSHHVVLPKHCYLEMDTDKPFVFLHEAKTTNGEFQNVYLDASTCRDIMKDHVCIAAVGLTTTGDIRDLFAESFSLGQVLTTIVLPGGRDRPIVPAEYSSRILTSALVKDGIKGFLGETEGITLNGDCCSAWVSMGKTNAIIGLHNGRAKNLVVSEFVPRSCFDYLDEDFFVEVQGVVLNKKTAPPLVEIETRMYGDEFYDAVEPDERSCVNFATMHPDGRCPIVEIYGSVKGTRSKSRSTVCATKLSPFLAAEGYPRKHGPPAFDQGANRIFANTFQKGQHPMKTVDPVAVTWAIADYLKPLVEKIHELKYYFTPLNLYESLNGRHMPAQHVMPMNMATSPGLGLSGTKKDHMDVVNDDKFGNIYTAKDYVVEEVARIESILASGNRAAPISKGAMKDEPTLIGKLKVRIFYVMPLVFLIIGRMILCPILCFLNSVPLLSEQWYGMRTTTDEWAQAYDYLGELGSDHVMNGDYSAYDQTISSQFITASGVIFYALAEAMGYSKYWLTVLHSWFADIANPIYAFNGTLLSFFGYMPSGHNGTVVVNGTNNSLLKRCFFYQMWLFHYGRPPAVGIFRNHCHFGFVGDDSIGTVDQELSWCNMQEYCAWCRAHGITYTMPDKSSDMVNFISLGKASLCKRSFRVLEVDTVVNESGRIVLAPIEVESILKSWHNLHKPQEDEWLVVRNNITQGLRELARHDRSVFDPIVMALRSALMSMGNEAPYIEEVSWSHERWQLDIQDRYNVKPENNTTLADDINEYIRGMWDD
jgi:hypothetical protein